MIAITHALKCITQHKEHQPSNNKTAEGLLLLLPLGYGNGNDNHIANAHTTTTTNNNNDDTTTTTTNNNDSTSQESRDCLTSTWAPTGGPRRCNRSPRAQPQTFS